MSLIVGEPNVIQFLSYNWPHSERLKKKNIRTCSYWKTRKPESDTGENWKEIGRFLLNMDMTQYCT